jgi:L-ascorbate metabolism protein UlaG (beta-lactamase superfamily)
MEITFIAQSGFIIREDNITIGIDIWLNNPVNLKQLADIPKLDYVFCTHDHDDHGFGDLIELAERDTAKFISVAELAHFAQTKGCQNIIGVNIGGEFPVDELKVYVTPALHSCDIGVPVGFIVQFPSGKTIYHMGDTGYFDLKYIPELYKVDTLFIPIGSRFTMGVREAIMAARDIKPKNVIPMHYNTFPQIEADAEAFKTMVETIGECGCTLMLPGENVEL